MRATGKLLLLYAAAVATGYVFNRLHVPLPWMIGPMVLVAVVNIAGGAVSIPVRSRSIGQTIVATAVGLYFTPAALAQVSTQAGYMIAVAAFTFAAGGAAAILLARLARVDATTAFFASIPGGPMEMAVMAEQFGRNGSLVALVQTLRIAFIVTVIPPVLLWSGTAPNVDRDWSSLTGLDPIGLPLLYLLTAATAFLFRRMRITNAFFLGPLAAAALITALGLHLATVPPLLVSAGQVLLGVSLGSRLDPDLLFRSGGFARAAAVSTAFLIGLSALLAIGIAAVSGLPVAAMVLSTAPGSVTEMAITAKTLQLDVALVTAFHLVRIFIIIPLTPLVFRLVQVVVGGRSRGSGAAGD